uniref:microtubule-associated protein futsch isoform X1 n=1 Tax=Scatophagus argus TaxID=75038 RepID=UPI001ED7ED80|nr:microtubule-associated protein futsch isoform X1 [Scatophagus argus]
MATVQCSKCTAERKGFRRELDSWRHKLIHCVGFESILEGIYGQMLLRDLKLFDDCEPEEVDDWSPEANCSQCSFCSLPLDKLSEQAPAAASPLSSPSDYSPCQAPTISESSQSAHRFLQAVFHKKDVPLGCDSNIPLVAQELMKKMIHQFALEYASKCLLHTNTNGVTTRTSLPSSETSDAPLDLTVSRPQEEKDSESEPDGVLDLSNRNSASSASTSSSNHKALGSLLPSLAEKLEDLGQRGTTCHQSSALDAVLGSLCPSHSSLLYQILKLAHQENLLLFLNHRPVGQIESHCCHCGVNSQDNVSPNAVPLIECKAHSSSPYYPLTDCDHQGHGSPMYHPGDCKSNCSIHHYPLTHCKSDAPLGSRYCCLQRSRMETYTVLCPKRLHCISCQSLSVGHTNNMVCSFALSSKSPSLCTPSSSLCPSSSICCNQHNPHNCTCYSSHAYLMQNRNTIDSVVGDTDPPCPVLKREQSPSPPPLSPIPSDISKKSDEKPPSLLHHREEAETDVMDKHGLMTASQQEADMDTAIEEEQECGTPRSSCAEQNPSGTSLQDVVNRFSEKLETIRPIEKDPSLVSTAVYVSEKESPSTSQHLGFHADAQLTEIITTVLHTGSASDYNLSELFNRHDSKEPKSPNTRSRRRQEVRAAIATSANDSSTRRHTLKIKRELAMLDQSYKRRKVPPSKRARLKDDNVNITDINISSDSNQVKEEPKRELRGVELEAVENHRVSEGSLNFLTAESGRGEVKEEIQTVIVTEEVQNIKAENKEREISIEEKHSPLSGTQILTPELRSKYGKQGSKHDSVQAQVMTVTASSAKQCVRPCEEDGMGTYAGSDRINEEATSLSDNRRGKGKDCHRPIRNRQKCQSCHTKETRRSRRNIVPPQRFSSYVTEPRKMYFVACFSGNIFHQKTQKDNTLTPGNLDALSQDPVAKDAKFESRNETPLSSPEQTLKLEFDSTQKGQCGPSFYKESNSIITNQIFPRNVAAKEESPAQHSSDNEANGSDCGAKSFRRLRSSPKRIQNSKTTSRVAQNTSNMNVAIKSFTCVESPPNSQVQYTSPIKLMFVSPVKDKEGVRYSLKSACSGSSEQAEEPFDPCEESSWSGTVQINKSQSTESATSRKTSVSSPLKSATSPARSASSPSKSASSPQPKSASSPQPKSASSPQPKSASSPRSKPAFLPRSKPASLPRPKSASSSPSKSASSSPSKSASSSPSKAASSSPSKAASSPFKSAASPSKSASSPLSKSPSSSPLKSASSPSKSALSPTSKPASSPLKVASSPSKSSSPAKSASSPKSASSSPKISSRRSGEGTPTKRLVGNESQRSPGDLLSFHETTPPKRRPGRPKKLGPRLEQKAKRPIGRPRKQKAVDSVMGAKSVNGRSEISSDVEENVNKNLKITVVYGRSRRNKRTVSEGFDQLQTEFHDACQAVGLKRDLGILMHNSSISSGSIKTASTELTEELHFVSPVKDSALQSSSNIKCQRQDDSVPSRKPGRPAKVKISGISVTVTTVSPRQRKIQINKDTRQSPETLMSKKILLPEFKSAKEPWTINRQATSKISLTEEGIETKDENKDKLSNQPVAVRHSMRVRKPSIHFLHAVATSTSRSYSHSNALLRRSKQLLLNKANNERRQAEQQNNVETSGEERQICGQERQNISQDLTRVAGVSVDSIFTQKETLRWWAVSAEEKTMNQELARRIRLISDTWVSDTVENQEKEIAFNSKIGAKGSRKSKHSSVVRTLFDCSPNKPRSCSMQQLCSWFMQTTETQSLAIVKKASSRNPYELMHFPRSANKKSVSHSPQAERLRKHIKKFAKMVPKSPLQHQQAQRNLRKRNEASLSTHDFRRQLFTPRFAADRLNQGAQWQAIRTFGKYQAALFRARTRFLNRKERERWQKRQRSKNNTTVATSCSHRHAVIGLQQKRKALHKHSAKYPLSDCLDNSSAANSVDQTQDPVDVPKEHNLCSKAWSPETLKECRVFLRKINSPDNESTEEEWDSCTVTLDDGSPSAYLFAARERELVGVVKAVKTERKVSTNRIASREVGSAPKSVQEQDEMPMGRQKGKYKRPRVVSTEPPQPPAAKKLRQSRMRGLTGPRWCDFVFEN